MKNHLERLYDGLLPEYRLQISRSSITNITELSCKCNEYEQIRQEEARTHRPNEYHKHDSRNHQTNHMFSVYDRKTHCWRCKQAGHQRFQCRNPTLLFCSDCGKDNVLSTECCRENKLAHPANRIFLNVKIKTLPFHALIDTGTSQTAISSKMIPDLKKIGLKLEKFKADIEVANQTLITSKYRVRLPVTVHDKTTWHYAVVMENLAENLILGIDFLLSRNYTLQIDGKALKPNRTRALPSIHAFTTRHDLEADQQQNLNSFIEEQKARFSTIRGPCRIAVHSIKLKHDQPIKQRYYPKNPAMQKVIDEEIDSLLEAGRIEPSTSAYSSPIVLVRKKQGTWRMCIDYRQLNAASIPDAYPLPQIQAILDQLKEAVIISSIDLKNGYWQIPLDENSSKYTAFTVPGRGLYQWKVMPFGLHSAPATFQRALDSLIGPELHPQIFAYLDDIIITGKTYKEHMKNLKIVCDKLFDANMQINFDKSDFAQTKVHYLGHVVSAEGIHTDPGKVEAIRQLPSPTNIKELRRVIGIASWYRRFVADFSTIIAPLTLLLKKNQNWQWGKEQEDAFVEIKHRLTTAPVLHCPNFSLPFILQTDASTQGLGAVLFQRHSDQERVIAYASRTLNAAEKNYSTTEQECLAILWGIRKMRSYLEGYHFTVITDHHSLKWLHQLQNPTGRLARWALEMQQYDFTIEYRKGSSNVVADALSRSPLTESPCNTLCAISVFPSNDWSARRIEQVGNNPQKFPDYQVVDGRLFRHITRKNPMSPDPEWKLCVPKCRQSDVLREIHDCPSAGHLGITKTLQRAKQSYYWPGMYRDVFNYVKECRCCNHYKPLQQKPAGLMTTMQCTQPWEIVCADFVGPLPRSSSGNTCLLVLVDKFSRWVELCPVRQATAKTIVCALREKIIYRFGCPQILLSDNGRQFISKELKQFLINHNIEHRFTAPYSPQENPTERTNRVVKTMISQLCDNSHRNWDKLLPEIAFAINTAIHESTKQSAAQIIFGRSPISPNQVINEGRIPSEETSYIQPSKRWAKIQEVAKIATAKQQKYFNKKRRQWEPQIGQEVYKRDHPLSSALNHFAQKLAPKFSGPYIITNRTSTNIYQLTNPATKNTTTSHIKDLKPYFSNNGAQTHTPDTSRQNTRVQHRGGQKRKQHLQHLTHHHQRPQYDRARWHQYTWRPKGG